MQWARLQSPALFRVVLTLPALAFLSEFIFVRPSFGALLQSSGEWAARLLIVTLCVTPIRYLLRAIPGSQQASMWLFKRRRDIGLAAFLYALFHLGTYVVRQANIHVILYDLPYKEYLMGWIGFATMLVLALTSNGRAVHALGPWWKRLQRLTYVAAAAVFLHWFWIRLDHWLSFLHFLPLILLEAYRLWYEFARPALRHRRQ
jgi:methionine sulfoxide reductase heme-binding subunit